VEAVNRGDSPVADVPSEVLGSLVGGDSPRLRATADFSALRGADAIVICVPTPVNRAKDPDIRFIVDAANQVACHLTKGTIVVLESTTYPGTTEELLLPRLQQAGPEDDWRVGEDFFLAFSPERIDPGRTDFTVRTTPKVIGGVTPSCGAAATALYDTIVEQTVTVSQPRTAEMVKLMENTFRALNIAYANEMAMICDVLGVDVWEVIDAATTKPFGYMPFYPGPGLGGHCIPVDPHYLAWKLRSLNQPARCIQLAAEINEAMPAFVVRRVSDALNESCMPLRGSAVLVLGVTYKPDVGDLRESPVLEVIERLLEKGAIVSYNDPFVPSLEIGGMTLESVELSEDAVSKAACVLVATNHSGYDWRWIADTSQLLFDARNATSLLDGPLPTVVRL
jgi:UDP-N-acetyl-D-glucosamine dehydrogenase